MMIVKKTKSLLLYVLLSIGLNTLCYSQAQTMDLSGTWQFSLDALNVGEHQQWFKNKLPSQVILPGTTDESDYGEVHIPGTPLYNQKPEIWGLAREHNYIGKAWYSKKVNIPEEWKNKKIKLFLERCMWQTKVWVNGNYVGENHSLCSPHQLNIDNFLKLGENVISISIDNSPYVHLGSWSHGYSPGIQSIWNGAVGKIELIAKDQIHLKNVQIYPSYKNQTLGVKVEVVSENTPMNLAKLQFVILDKNNKEIVSKEETVLLKKGVLKFGTNIDLNNKLKPWDEFEPNLYTLKIKSADGNYTDFEEIRFGLRDIETKDGRFVVNGKKIIMRGEHDAGSFPQTGYASMDKKDWLRIYKIGKEYGLNHWRFHSWCPPEAAFEAADEVGIYLQPELTLFSQDWEGTLVGTDSDRDVFLFEELKKLLDTYGNHPSFALMCMGNELRGNHEVLEKWVAWGKKHDPRHLYTGSANLEAMKKYERLQGDDFQVAHAGKYNGKRVARRMKPYFKKEKPNTVNDYSHTILPPFDKWPIISHETGQWAVFPDFTEIEKYKGVLLPRNLNVFKSRLKQKGMLSQAVDFVQASGKLSAALYREEMERVLRTPGMGGFQLLDLRDYQAQGSALIGMLNAFWEPKGFITAKEFRQSCNDITVLLKMPKRVWKNNEQFSSELVIPNYGAVDLAEVSVNWTVKVKGNSLFSGQLEKTNVKQGEVVSIGNISFDLHPIDSAQKLSIKLSVPELNIQNNYDFWVYPEQVKDENWDIIIATEATPRLLQKIKNGANVLLVPKENYDAERMAFTTAFWSTIMFDYQPKTLGVLCDPEHPVFNNFPTDFHTNWQWWDLMRGAFAMRLNFTEMGYKPLLQVIDHPVRNDKLGAMVETSIGRGKLFVTTLDILNDLEKRPVARQLRYSILKYMTSRAFEPSEVNGIEQAFFDYQPKVGYKQIWSSSENSEYPIAFAFDEDQKTYWESIGQEDKIVVEIEFPKERYITGCILNVSGMQSAAEGFKVFVTNKKDEKGHAIISGNNHINGLFESKSWDNGFTIQKGKKGKYALIEFYNKSANPIRLNEIKWVFGD